MAIAEYIAYRRAVASENNQRIAGHKAAVMLRAGARPLNLLADGDSWFDYPLDNGIIGINTDVIAQLRTQLPTALILNLAHAGDATTQTLGVSKFDQLSALLTDPDHGGFDAILFSGGGDDLVGDQFRFWLNDASRVDNDPAQAINTAALNGILAVIETAYRDLALLRNLAGDPGVPIISHAYDFATPDGRQACTLGPWLFPSLQSRGWMRDPQDPNDLSVGQSIVKAMLLRFDHFMQMLENDPYLNLIYVRTQGTLAPGPADWDNELHPKPPGFAKIAAKFADRIKERFPGRV